MTGARITFAGLGSVWFDEAADLDAEKFDAILDDYTVEWVEFEFGPVQPKSIKEMIVDKAVEVAVEATVNAIIDKRPAYRRIEFGGRHGGKMARMGRR